MTINILFSLSFYRLTHLSTNTNSIQFVSFRFELSEWKDQRKRFLCHSIWIWFVCNWDDVRCLFILIHFDIQTKGNTNDMRVYHLFNWSNRKFIYNRQDFCLINKFNRKNCSSETKLRRKFDPHQSNIGRYKESRQIFFLSFFLSLWKNEKRNDSIWFDSIWPHVVVVVTFEGERTRWLTKKKKKRESVFLSSIIVCLNGIDVDSLVVVSSICQCAMKSSIES